MITNKKKHQDIRKVQSSYSTVFTAIFSSDSTVVEVEYYPARPTEIQAPLYLVLSFDQNPL